MADLTLREVNHVIGRGGHTILAASKWMQMAKIAREAMLAKDGLELCDTCDGTGEVHSHNPTCWTCDGSGALPKSVDKRIP